MHRKARINKCPNCGTEVKEPIKTWQLVAPIPDKKGRITVTVMGVFQCPECGYKWRGVVSKVKVGGTGIEIGGKEIKEEEKRPPRIIEINIDNLEEEFED